MERKNKNEKKMFLSLSLECVEMKINFVAAGQDIECECHGMLVAFFLSSYFCIFFVLFLFVLFICLNMV